MRRAPRPTTSIRWTSIRSTSMASCSGATVSASCRRLDAWAMERRRDARRRAQRVDRAPPRSSRSRPGPVHRPLDRRAAAPGSARAAAGRRAHDSPREERAVGRGRAARRRHRGRARDRPATAAARGRRRRCRVARRAGTGARRARARRRRSSSSTAITSGTGSRTRSVSCRAGSVSPGPAVAWLRLRCPVVADEPVAPFERVAAVADFGSGIGNPLPFVHASAINPEVTIHVHRHPVGEWVCLESAAWTEPHGVGLGRVPLARRARPARPRRCRRSS